MFNRPLITCKPDRQTLTGHYVSQGNGKGKCIHLSSNEYLYTSDLNDCVAILIIDKHARQCAMIHSDANDGSGIDRTRLQDGFRKLNLSAKYSEYYSISFLGGNSDLALRNKQNTVKEFFPDAKVKIRKPNVDSAYLMGNKTVTHSWQFIN